LTRHPRAGGDPEGGITPRKRSSRQHTNLQTLIFGIGVTDAEMPEVGKLTQLQTLDLRETRMTDTGKHALRKTLPNLLTNPYGFPMRINQ